jgi:hypothetical protein
MLPAATVWMRCLFWVGALQKSPDDERRGFLLGPIPTTAGWSAPVPAPDSAATALVPSEGLRRKKGTKRA